MLTCSLVIVTDTKLHSFPPENCKKIHQPYPGVLEEREDTVHGFAYPLNSNPCQGAAKPHQTPPNARDRMPGMGQLIHSFVLPTSCCGDSSTHETSSLRTALVRLGTRTGPALMASQIVVAASRSFVGVEPGARAVPFARPNDCVLLCRV